MATTAFGVVLDECLAQITPNAIGLVEGNPILATNRALAEALAAVVGIPLQSN